MLIRQEGGEGRVAETAVRAISICLDAIRTAVDKTVNWRDGASRGPSATAERVVW